jgi:hypothetical protein
MERLIRLLAITLVVLFLLVIGAVAGFAPGRASDEPPATTTVTVQVPARYHGGTAAHWAARFRHRTRQLQVARHDTKRLRRTLLSRPSVTEALNLAATVYGNGATLWALARCESNLNPQARNASGSSGLLQFMPSTFASTPYRGFSIWSPYANALAGGWMLTQGRRGEWVC